MKDQEEKEIMAYVAGLIDGDGCIALRIGPRGKICPLIQFHNSSKQPSIFLNNLFGGTIACDKPKKEGNKPIWKWMLQGEKGCSIFLKRVLSHLILKKDSALLMESFLQDSSLGREYYQRAKDLNLNRKLIPIEIENLERKNSQSEFFWAYTAGIMDTDGSFSIERSVRKAGSPGSARQKNDLVKFRPKITLTMSTQESIKYIAQNCEHGYIFVVKCPATLRGKGLRFSVQSRSSAVFFLKKCIPYLQIKSIQAIKLLSFCRNFKDSTYLARVSEEEKEYREGCYKEMIMLNK